MNYFAKTVTCALKIQLTKNKALNKMREAFASPPHAIVSCRRLYASVQRKFANAKLDVQFVNFL
jgi:hypothetical protein